MGEDLSKAVSNSGNHKLLYIPLVSFTDVLSTYHLQYLNCIKKNKSFMISLEAHYG